jgi:hypothetical protein
MTWLNAILAFSLAMIVFCTIVSALTEVVHELAKRREKGLRWMLTRLYVDVLEPYSRKLTDVAVDAEKELESDFLERLAMNNASARGRNVPLSSLAFNDFVERLADTNVGQRLYTALKAEAEGRGTQRIEAMLADLGRAFARFESDATAHFAGWARWFTVMVSLVVAFALNVDAVRLFSTFVADRNLTQAMLVRADEITVGLQAQHDHKDEAKAQTLDAEAATLRQQIQSTSALGLPIGIRYFPWCQDDGSVDPACSAEKANVLLWGRWFLSIAFAGVLIGLGGPFWFDVSSNLSQFMQRSRTDKGGSPPGEATAARPTAAGIKYPNAAQLAPLFVAAAEFAATVRAGRAQEDKMSPGEEQ